MTHAAGRIRWEKEYPRGLNSLDVHIEFAEGLAPMRGIVHMVQTPEGEYSRITIGLGQKPGGIHKPSNRIKMSQYIGKRAIIYFTKRPDIAPMDAMFSDINTLDDAKAIFIIFRTLHQSAPLPESTNPGRFKPVFMRDPNTRVRVVAAADKGVRPPVKLAPYRNKPARYVHMATPFLIAHVRFWYMQLSANIIIRIMQNHADLGTPLSSGLIQTFLDCTDVKMNDEFFKRVEPREDAYQHRRLIAMTALQQEYAAYEPAIWIEMGKKLIASGVEGDSGLDAHVLREIVREFVWFKSASLSMQLIWPMQCSNKLGHVRAFFFEQVWEDMAGMFSLTPYECFLYYATRHYGQPLRDDDATVGVRVRAEFERRKVEFWQAVSHNVENLILDKATVDGVVEDNVPATRVAHINPAICETMYRDLTTATYTQMHIARTHYDEHQQEVAENRAAQDAEDAVSEGDDVEMHDAVDEEEEHIM